MRRRCLKETHTDYARYGGRGIKVCDRWSKFENFLADMGEPPPGMTIERVNNDGNYEPANCKWATRAEQGANRSTVRRVVIDGIEMSLRAACGHLGLKPETIYMRLHRGASVEEALR
jgi:hypothetical protein